MQHKVIRNLLYNVCYASSIQGKAWNNKNSYQQKINTHLFHVIEFLRVLRQNHCQVEVLFRASQWYIIISNLVVKLKATLFKCQVVSRVSFHLLLSRCTTKSLKTCYTTFFMHLPSEVRPGITITHRNSQCLEFWILLQVVSWILCLIENSYKMYFTTFLPLKSLEPQCPKEFKMPQKIEREFYLYEEILKEIF